MSDSGTCTFLRDQALLTIRSEALLSELKFVLRKYIGLAVWCSGSMENFSAYVCIEITNSVAVISV